MEKGKNVMNHININDEIDAIATQSMKNVSRIEKSIAKKKRDVEKTLVVVNVMRHEGREQNSMAGENGNVVVTKTKQNRVLSNDIYVAKSTLEKGKAIMKATKVEDEIDDINNVA
ncbi:unnamed protein product [Vicia faba]|uniref:Uncharacterized protein n=1 Tax=Vicia faba TaxID=3906 RepID=A0AAV1BC29_VICFA|nr:unnamed protein product [Vicia faba]